MTVSTPTPIDVARQTKAAAPATPEPPFEVFKKPARPVAHHGTVSKWQAGCRTDEECPGHPETRVTCREARNAYQREGRRRRAELAAEAQPVVESAPVVEEQHPVVAAALEEIGDDAAEEDRREPFVGARARVRYDDGVGIVREVLETRVRVSWLLDPRADEDDWAGWLNENRISEPIDATEFVFDEFPPGSVAPSDLALLAAEGDPGAATAMDNSEYAEPVEEELTVPVDEVAASIAVWEARAELESLNREVDGEPDLPADADQVNADVVAAMREVGDPESLPASLEALLEESIETFAWAEDGTPVVSEFFGSPNVEVAIANHDRDIAQKALTLVLQKWGQEKTRAQLAVAAAQAATRREVVAQGSVRVLRALLDQADGELADLRAWASAEQEDEFNRDLDARIAARRPWTTWRPWWRA